LAGAAVGPGTRGRDRGGERAEGGPGGTLQRVVAQHEPGEVVAVEVIRYGAALRFDVRLTQAEIAAPPTPQVSGPVGGPEERLGLRLGDLTEARAGEFGYTRAGGV